MRRPRYLLTFATASNLFSLFKISLENFFKTKFYLYLKLHIQPSELDNLEYYEFHYLVKDLVEHLKEENKQNEKQNEAYGSSMPKIPNLKVPNLSVPKF
jgi:hypothetical protein